MTPGTHRAGGPGPSDRSILSMLMDLRTASIHPDDGAAPRTDWALIVAMDCQAIGAPPEGMSLAEINTVAIGRGDERRLVVDAGTARLELNDQWISHSHARLERRGDRWTLEDEGSRNGSWVNGERIERRMLGDGDVIECGGTFLILRRNEFAIPSADSLGGPEALRTMSPALSHELRVLRRVARSPIPVLVLGQSGTGKEGIANAVHTLSGREGPFVAVNCGAIPATLIESE